MPGHKQAKIVAAARKEARRYAYDNPAPTGDPGHTLQNIHDRTRDSYLYACQKVDELPEDEIFVQTAFGPLENQWLRLESRFATELTSLCVNIERVGLQERMVRIEEGKAALLVRALTEAAREAGIPREQVRKLGPALRTQLQVLEGGQAS